MNGEAGHVFSLSKSLVKRGHRVILACRTQRKGKPVTIMMEKARSIPGVEIVPLLLERGFSLRTDLADLGTLDRLCESNEDLTIIHSHRSKEHWLSLLLRRRHPRIRTVRTRHVVTRTHKHPLNRWLYRKTDAVIATSTAILDGLAESGIRSRDDIVVLHGGVDTERFNPAVSGEAFRNEFGLAQDESIVLAVGHLDPVKGYDVLIEAFAEVHRQVPNSRLVIVGEDSSLSQEQFRSQASDLGLAESVILTGRREDVPQIMAACQVGVISSVGSEGNSRVALEFMASQKPVVATTVGCLPDLIRPEQNGVIVEPGRSNVMEESIIRLLQNPDEANRFGQEGRGTVESEYSEHLVAEQIEKIYADLLV